MRFTTLCVVAFVSLGIMFYSVAGEPVGKYSKYDIANELASDPMLSHYQEQLLNIDRQIADLESTGKQSNSPGLKRLRQVRQAVKKNLQKHRTTKEQEIRRRLNIGPNDLLAPLAPTLTEQEILAMSDEQLRKTIAVLSNSVKNLERRVYELEEANKLRIELLVESK